MDNLDVLGMWDFSSLWMESSLIRTKQGISIYKLFRLNAGQWLIDNILSYSNYQANINKFWQIKKRKINNCFIILWKKKTSGEGILFAVSNTLKVFVTNIKQLLFQMISVDLPVFIYPAKFISSSDYVFYGKKKPFI